MTSPFDRPIPGQSLTDEPRNNPWENPAEMSDIEEVTKYYINRLADQDVIDDLSAVMEAGVPLKPVVETITSAGTMRGLHSIDSAMLVGPIIHQFLKSAMETQGVSVRDTGRNYEKESAEKEMMRVQLLTAKYLSENPDDGMDEGKKVLSEMAEAGEPEEEVTPEEKPMGLMAKG
tara:strand:- start:913 stop:1437 length:525 start_codon:yes stop_codon:yes gene_type:complete